MTYHLKVTYIRNLSTITHKSSVTHVLVKKKGIWSNCLLRVKNVPSLLFLLLLKGYLYPLWSYIASFSQQPEQNNLQIDANGPVIVGGGEMREQPEQNNLRIDANGPVIVGSASGNTFNTYLRGKDIMHFFLQ